MAKSQENVANFLKTPVEKLTTMCKQQLEVLKMRKEKETGVKGFHS